MKGKQVIDTISLIVKRQDLDRSLALFFVNSITKDIFRSTFCYKMVSYVTELTPVNGDVTVPRLKDPRYVEFNLDGQKTYLKRLQSFEQVFSIFGEVSLLEPYTFGVPEYYIVTEFGIKLYPIPTEGQVSVFGEFYPQDLKDDEISENVFSVEIPNVLVYLAASEYFDMLGEPDKAKYWREKGAALMQNYFSLLKRQNTNNTEMMNRDPWGNLGYDRGLVPRTSGITMDVIDGGEW
ncbi:hypothetical protein [Anaeroselena agilis]|uniref:Uncharacterized protein n=1 Tax=Anaeroselena agilis TaxID=3063788 RepID=A0ABU3NVV4_9FIRM|nr:hypothetical protein [Selenomonadales bacterium 4137-cl]